MIPARDGLATLAEIEWCSDRLIDILAPKKGVLLAVLEGYFDESERPGTKVFCVAGHVFQPHQAKAFADDWRSLWGEYLPFHMTDFVSRREQFSGMTDEDHLRLIQGAIAIIRERVDYSVAVSCKLSEIHAIKRGGSPAVSAYSMCIHLCMSQVGDWVRKTGRDDRVAYVFEQGYGTEADARASIAESCQEPTLRESYRYAADAFLPKGTPQLQAADFLAWEWAKCYDETLDQPKRQVRASLWALAQGRKGRYWFSHAPGLNVFQALRAIEDPSWSAEGAVRLLATLHAIDRLGLNDQVEALLRGMFGEAPEFLKTWVIPGEE